MEFSLFPTPFPEFVVFKRQRLIFFSFKKNRIMGILLIAPLKCRALPLLRLACLDADLAHSQQRSVLRSAPGNHGLNPVPHVLP